MVILGDVMTVNWVYKPYMDVRARKYRFRMLNGSVSRYMKIAVAYQDPTNKNTLTQVPFHLIANDGNILQHAVAFPNSAAGQGLPTQSIAERLDIVVDFAPLYAKVSARCSGQPDGAHHRRRPEISSSHSGGCVRRFQHG